VDAPDAQVDVVFVVNEHAKVQVKGVGFIGNTRMPAAEIQKVMATREGSLLSLVTDMGNYRDENLQRDLQAIQALYLDDGYVTVKVGTPSVSLSPDKRFIFVTIPIEEGEQYTIGKIGFAGQLLDQEPRLRRIVRSRRGEWFSRETVARDLFAVGDVFKDLGYAYANVTPLTDTNADTRIVDLTFEVQPGALATFERIEVVGNDKTRDKVIRRELRISEGERYSGTGVRDSKMRVNALGFFETVEISTKRGSADDKIIATVEVKERPTGTFQIGAGFSSYENFILTGQISQQNFFGWGQTLSLQIQWSSIRQLGQIQFVEPHFLDTRWTFAFDLYMTEGVYTTFTRRSVGGSMTWGYELVGLERWWSFARHLEDMRLFATYTNERVDVTAAQASTTTQAAFKSGTTSSVRLSLQWDKRDNRLFPTRGFYFSGSVEAAPPFLAPSRLFGENVNLFRRYTLDGRIYRPLFWGLVFRARLTLGLIQAWDVEHQLPISELYYLGGINTIRGYRYLSISPTANVRQVDTPDSPIEELTRGGDKQAYVNLEVEFPLFPTVGVRGVVFTDAGNVYAPGAWHDPAVSWSLYKSVGFGFRWISPIGPLRFEWGFPLNPRRNLNGSRIDQPVDFQFTIGNFF
jgi:outer membrane protein insertion porin family